MYEQNAIKSMPLYVDVERINNELTALGIGVDEALTPAQLFPFDQYHYHGTDAVDAAVRLLGLGPASHVLDVGSGLGGPARYLASTIGCHITALEHWRAICAHRHTLKWCSGSGVPPDKTLAAVGAQRDYQAPLLKRRR
jgi:hypothetical protein